MYLIAPLDAEPLLDLGRPAEAGRLPPLLLDGLLHDISDLLLIDTHIQFESWVLRAFTLRASDTIAKIRILVDVEDRDRWLYIKIHARQLCLFCTHCLLRIIFVKKSRLKLFESGTVILLCGILEPIKCLLRCPCGRCRWG